MRTDSEQQAEVPEPACIAVVGAGHAAGQVVASLRQHEYSGRILLIGEETWLPYQRPPLSKKYLAGKLPAERLHFKPKEFYDQPQIDVLLGCRIESLQRNARIVRAADGREFAWDSLVLALGARARRLPIPGDQLPGAHYLRGIDDVNAIRESIAKGRRLIVIGGGYIGLEVAAVARTLGQEVVVVEAAGRVMSRVVSPTVSEFYADLHRTHGVELQLGCSVVEITGEHQVNGVLLGSGQRIEADTVVIGIGIEPNTQLADDAGLTVDNGIVVDDRCRTEDPAIYAVGDCTSHPNAVFGRAVRLESVHNALEQAKTAAANLCGIITTYSQVPWFWSDQYDVKLQIAGLSEGYDNIVVRGDPGEGSFSCVYLREGNVIAVDAINRPRDFVQAKRIIAERAAIEPWKLADSGAELKQMV